MAKRREKGAYVALLALSLPALMAVLGFAIDTGAMHADHRRMQIAADAAALSGAYEIVNLNDMNTAAAALKDAERNGFRNDGIHTVTVNYPPQTGEFKNVAEHVEVIVSGPQPLYFMSVFGIEPKVIRARAVAKATPREICMVVLNPTMSGSLLVNGNATVAFADCAVIVNSDHSIAAQSSGNGKLSATDVLVVGNYSGTGFTPKPRTGVRPLADPLANFVMPAVGNCTAGNTTTINTVQTLNPGVYCGGLDLKGQAQVTLNPGLYVLAGGGVRAGAGASLTGTDVTFVNTQVPGKPYEPVNISAGARLTLSAPSAGLWKGILFYQDPKITSTKVNKFNGNGALNLTGIAYFPTTSVEMTGTFSGSSRALLFIVDNVSFGGNVTLQKLPRQLTPQALLAARLVE